jgi:hypothetical protein
MNGAVRMGRDRENLALFQQKRAHVSVPLEEVTRRLEVIL